MSRSPQGYAFAGGTTYVFVASAIYILNISFVATDLEPSTSYKAITHRKPSKQGSFFHRNVNSLRTETRSGKSSRVGYCLMFAKSNLALMLHFRRYHSYAERATSGLSSA